MQVSPFTELLRSDCSIVFSSIPDRTGYLEETLLQDGRIVFSNSAYRRFDADVALVVTEVNAGAIGHRRLVKNPNCVTSGLALVLEPLKARYGLRKVAVATYQSLSGRGDAKYARDLVLANIYPLHASSEGTEGYIRREVKKIMGGGFPVSVTCNRVCVQEGHFVEVRLNTEKQIGSTEEVENVLSAFNPFAGLNLHSSPQRPIVVITEPGRPRPIQDAYHHGGMAVAVGNLSTDDEVFDLRLTYVVNNLVRGAAGGALLNAEFWETNIADQAARAESVSASGATT
jgi:aspartate-semialdehyde dehydrogenase